VGEEAVVRKLAALGMAVVLLGWLAAPARACHSVDVCMDFSLVRTSAAANTWTLTAWYAVGSETLTGIALYANSGSLATGVSATSTAGPWVSGTYSNSVPVGKTRLFSVKSNGSSLSAAGNWTSYVTINFTSSLDVASLAGLGVRSSFASGNWDDDLLAEGDGPECPTHTVPEPISMLLLGAGLLGIGSLRLRRRRK